MSMTKKDKIKVPLITPYFSLNVLACSDLAGVASGVSSSAVVTHLADNAGNWKTNKNASNKDFVENGSSSSSENN